MTKETLAAQIRSMEVQLSMLRAGLKRLSPSAPGHTIADLEGLLAGKTMTTDEELEAAQYRGSWDDDPASEGDE